MKMMSKSKRPFLYHTPAELRNLIKNWKCYAQVGTERERTEYQYMVNLARAELELRGKSTPRRNHR
jgi:hypothetical protein